MQGARDHLKQTAQAHGVLLSQKNLLYMPFCAAAIVFLIIATCNACAAEDSLIISDLDSFVCHLRSCTNGATDFVRDGLPPSLLSQLVEYDNGGGSNSQKSPCDFGAKLTLALNHLATNSQDEPKAILKDLNEATPNHLALASLRKRPRSPEVIRAILLASFPSELALCPDPGSGEKSAEDKKGLIHHIDRIVAKLDDVDRVSQEWGRASVSDLALIDNDLRRSNGYFALNYTNSAANYVGLEGSTVQGAVAHYLSTAFAQETSVQVTPPAGKLPSLGGSSAPAGTNSNSASSTNATSSGGSASSSNGTVSLPGSLIGNLSPTNFLNLLAKITNTTQLSPGNALVLGLSDKETELILNYVSSPQQVPDNKRAFLAVMQVSVLPGWRTARDYVCEVQIRFQYALSREGCIKRYGPGWDYDDFVSSYDPDDKQRRIKLNLPVSYPSIIAAFPFAQAQILDLQNSLAHQLDLLTQVAGQLNPQVQAKVLNEFKRYEQQDTATRSMLPLVVPSSQGYDVTYRFDRQLQAMADPAKYGSNPAQLLQPTSFPALVLIICDEGELRNYDEICASVETRWVPAKHRSWLKQNVFDWVTHGYRRGIPYLNRDRIKAASQLTDVQKKLEGMQDKVDELSPQYMELQRRFMSLQNVALGIDKDVFLPPTRPYLAAVYPYNIREDFITNGTKISLLGHFFETPCGKVDSAFIGGPTGISLDLNYDSGDKRWTAKLPEHVLSPGRYDVEVAGPGGQYTLYHALQILPVPPPQISQVFSEPLGTVIPPGHSYPCCLVPCGDRTQTITVVGSNFWVNDKSLIVALSGKTLTRKPAHNNNRLDVCVNPQELNMKPGFYDLTVSTSGGEATFSNAIQVFYETRPGENPYTLVPPVVTSVFPTQIRADARNVQIRILGNFFDQRGLKVHFAGLVSFTNFTVESAGSLSMYLVSPPAATSNEWLSLQVANDAGSATLTNALLVTPVPPPVVAAILPSQIELLSKASVISDFNTTSNQCVTASNAFIIASNKLAKVVAGEAHSNNVAYQNTRMDYVTKSNEFAECASKLVTYSNLLANIPIVRTNLTVFGANLLVQDGSSWVAISNIVFGTNYFTTLSDGRIDLTLETNALKGLKPGKYNLTVLTSGGQAVLTNGIQLVDPDAKPPPSNPVGPGITSVTPHEGYLHIDTLLTISGTNLLDPGFFGNKLPVVTIGGRRGYVFQDKSGPSNIIVRVPPWTNYDASQEATMMTNKFDVIVVTSHGVAVSTNAVVFDRTIPVETKDSLLATPDGIKMRKIAEAVSYMGGVLGTNVTIDSSVSLSASVGSKPAKPVATSPNSATVQLPAVSASISINTNLVAAPAPGSPSSTNTPPAGITPPAPMPAGQSNKPPSSP
jgi:hypothetical protein